MWFNTVTNIWYEYNGSTFTEVVRVLAAKYTNATTLQSVSIDAPAFTGTQVGLTSSARVGSLVFDSTGAPIKTGSGNKFFTTEDAFVTGVPTGAGLRVNNIVVSGQANAPIAAYQVVQYNDYAQIGVADPFQQGLRVFGILEEDAATNEVVNFLVEGMIYNSAWDWPAAGADANDPVYADFAGMITLTPVIPNQLPVGVVIGIQEILFAPGLFPQIVATNPGITDHGNLEPSSLLDDDHPQYHNDARGDLRYLQLATGGTLQGNLIMNAGTDVILTDLPINPTDAANKQYVDQISAGLDFKDSVHMCTTANLPGTYDNGTAGLGATLTATVNGVLPPSITDNHAHYVVGDRVLVKSQTDGVENGLFEVTDTGSGENVTEVITQADVADSLDGTHFTFEEAAGGAGFYVWYNTPAGAGDPAPAGSGIEVSIPTGAFALQVTTATIDAINASTAGVTAYIDENNSLYIVDDVTGTRTPAGTGTSPFTVSTPIPGTASPTPWILTRTQDADNSPSNEVSNGLFVFVEDGETCAGTGWVMTEPTGAADLGIDELVFTQFSAVPTVNPSRIQDLDNNTYIDVEQSADNNNVVIQGGPRDVANTGGDIIANSGSAASGSGFDGGGVQITTGAADPLLVGGFGGDFSVTTGLAGQGGLDGQSGSILLESPDSAQYSGGITLSTGNATGAGSKAGAIDLRPGVSDSGGTSSANVNILGSAAGGGLVESGLKFIPKANLVSRFGVGFSAPVTVAADVIWKLPGADGTNGQVLTTDGSGVLSWSAGGGTPNLWETIVSDSGSATADSPTDSLSILGGAGIDTAVVGDVLTISAVEVIPTIALAFGGFGSEGAALSTVYTSADDITTWTGARPGHGGTFVGPKGAAYAPAIDTWVYTSSTKPAYYSTDNGITWTAAPRVNSFTNTASGATGTNLAWSETLGLFIMGGNSGQIQKSSDGIVWSDSTDAPPNVGTFGSSQITTTTWSETLGLFFVGTTNNEVGYSADGDNWTLTATEPGGPSTVDIDSIYVVGSRIFVGRDNSTVYYSDNNGTSWTQSTLSPAAPLTDCGAFAANNDGSIIIMGGVGLNDGEFVWRSTDNGVNFTRIDAGTSAGVGTNMYAFSFIFDTDYGFIMGGRDAGLDEHIILTSPDGLTWTLQLSEKYVGPPAERNDFDAIASKKQNGQIPLVAGTEVGGATGFPAAVDECTTLVANSANAFVERPALELPHPYDIAAQVFGEAPAGGIVLKFVAPHEITLFEYGHWGDAETPPTAGDRVFDVRKNGVSVGTILFEQNGLSGGLITDFGISQVGTAGAPAIQLAQGDVLTVISPSDGDSQGSTGTGNAGLEDVAMTLRGHVLPGSAISCITPDFTLTDPADAFSSDFTISGIVGGITHFEVAVVAYGDPFETGVPATTTFFPTSDQTVFGPNGADIDDGTTLVSVTRESQYATLPYDTTTFDVFDSSGGSRYILVRVCGFAPGGIVCKQGFMETAGA
jgi:hypothetical protein